MDCGLSLDDVEHISRLVVRVRVHVGVREDIPRAAVVRALLRKGLDLEQTRTLSIESGRCEAVFRLQYMVSAGELRRLTELQGRYQAAAPLSAKLPLTSLQRSLFRLAFVEAETMASFPGFAKDVIASRLKRGPSSGYARESRQRSPGRRDPCPC
jgi:hypothetical protein